MAQACCSPRCVSAQRHTLEHTQMAAFAWKAVFATSGHKCTSGPLHLQLTLDTLADVESDLGCLSDVTYNTSAAESCLAGASTTSCPASCGSLLGSVRSWIGPSSYSNSVVVSITIIKSCLARNQ